MTFSPHPSRFSRLNERGQILAIVAVGMLSIIAMVGLVIDGGFAWAQQRETQNGTDAVALAGATVIQQSIGGAAKTSGDVGCAMKQAADANGLELEVAVYTDAFGEPLAPEEVVPTCAPGAGGLIPPGAQGVRDEASQTFDTFLMRVIGFDTMTAEANAVAVVGKYAGATGAILPVTIPLSFSTCDSSLTTYKIGEGAWAFRPTEADRTSATLVTLPLCDAGPGSVGWLDMGCRSNISEFITNPCELSIPIPDWLHTQTGNVNNLETVITDYTGTNGDPSSWGIADDSIVSIPIHTNTCDVDPGDLAYCPPTADAANQWKGDGDNLYYYIDGWVGFMVDQAHTSGGDVQCRQAPGTPVLVNPTPAGKVGCLKGWFVEEVTPGPIVVGEIDPDAPGTIGVTLVN
jgi:hypothetical protein